MALENVPSSVPNFYFIFLLLPLFKINSLLCSAGRELAPITGLRRGVLNRGDIHTTCFKCLSYKEPPYRQGRGKQLASSWARHWASDVWMLTKRYPKEKSRAKSIRSDFPCSQVLVAVKVGHHCHFEVVRGALYALSHAILIAVCGCTQLQGLLRAMSCMVICMERGSAPQNTLPVEKILVVDCEGRQQRNISKLHFFYRGGGKQC